jgi:hypothetical protein
MVEQTEPSAPTRYHHSLKHDTEICLPDTHQITLDSDVATVRRLSAEVDELGLVARVEV